MVTVVYSPLEAGLRGRTGPVNDIFAAFAAALDGFQTPDVYNTGKGGFGAGGGVADAYTVTLDPVATAYTTGMAVSFIPPATNTGGACTLNVDGLGVKSVLDFNGENPEAGMIPAGRVVVLRYSGTVFHVTAVSVTTTVSDGAVTNAKLADMAEARIKGRADGAGTGVPVDLTAAQVAAIIAGETLTVGTPATADDALNETAADAIYDRQDARVNFWSGAKESGRTFTNPFMFTSYSTHMNPVSGRIYMIPIFLGEPVTLSGLGYFVTSGGSGDFNDKIRLGVYSNVAGAPGTLLHQTVETGATSLGGDKEIAFAVEPTVGGGWYWLAFVVGGTASTDFRIARRVFYVHGPNSQVSMLQSSSTDATWGTSSLPASVPTMEEFGDRNGIYLYAVAT